MSAREGEPRREIQLANEVLERLSVLAAFHKEIEMSSSFQGAAKLLQDTDLVLTLGDFLLMASILQMQGATAERQRRWAKLGEILRAEGVGMMGAEESRGLAVLEFLCSHTPLREHREELIQEIESLKISFLKR